MNGWRLASMATLTSGAAVILAVGGCASGPEETTEATVVVACDADEASGEAACPAEGAAASEASTEVACEVEPEGEPEVEVVVIAEGEDGTVVEAEVVAVTTTTDESGEVVVVVEAMPVETEDTDAETVEVVEVIEVVEVDEAEAAGTEETVEVGEAMPVETEDTDADIEAEEAVEVVAVEETETVETEETVEEIAEEIVEVPTFGLSLELASTEDGAGRRMIEHFASLDAEGPTTAALAAATAERLQQLAQDGRSVERVRLYRVSLDRDQADRIPATGDGAEVMVAKSGGVFPQILGADAEGTERWRGVKSYRASAGRPMLIWDRRAERDGWSGWMVVIVP